MASSIQTLRNVVFLLCLTTLIGCLIRGSGEPDIFVEDSPFDTLGGAAFNSSEGGYCRSSKDCSGDLRCINTQGFQFCVETCDAASECGSEQCNPVVADDGWCALPSENIGTPSTGDNPDIVGEPDPNPNPDPTPDPDPTLDPDPGADPTPTPGPSDTCGGAEESEQLRLLNIDRTDNGLAPVQCESRLSAVAFEHSQDMSDRGFFDHINPDGEAPWDRMERNGITGWRTSGENIAYGYVTPKEVEEGWMNSPGHRANILNEQFTHVGIGRFVDDQGLPYWTQLFARF